MQVRSDYNSPTNVKVASVASSLIGTGIATLCLAKGKFTNIPKLEMGIKDAFIISVGSIAGGLTGGCLSDSKDQRVYKVREASNQLMGNTVVPLACLAVVNKLTKPLHKVARAIIAMGTLVYTTFVGHKVADKVNNKIFKEQRKYNVGVKDFITDFDDLLFASSTVLNSKNLYKATACICPFTYSSLGVMSGTRHKENNKKVLDTKV